MIPAMTTEFIKGLAGKFLDWRTKKNDFTLHEAKKLLGLSIGYISDLENGKLDATTNVFLKYNAVDGEMFPLSDANLLI